MIWLNIVTTPQGETKGCYNQKLSKRTHSVAQSNQSSTHCWICLTTFGTITGIPLSSYHIR